MRRNNYFNKDYKDYKEVAARKSINPFNPCLKQNGKN